MKTFLSFWLGGSIASDLRLTRKNRITGLLISGTMFALVPFAPRAELSTTASVTGQYEDNSNVYDLQHGYLVPGTTDYKQSDSDFVYGGSIQLKYLWSLQEFYALASGDEFRYDHFTQLNHNDYKLNGGWDWKAGLILDGTLDVLRSSTMVPFTDVMQSIVAVQTEQRETAKI